MAPTPGELARSAIFSGNSAGLRALLATGVDVQARDSDGWTALHYAAISGRTACLEVLLAAGASVDSVEECDYKTPLHFAACSGRAACVRALIAAGADVNRGTRSTGRRRGGSTPFSFALINDSCPILKILLRAGANVYTEDCLRVYNTKSWALVDAIRKLGGWPNYVRRRRATLGIWVIRRLPTVIEIEIAACIEPPGGF